MVGGEGLGSTPGGFAEFWIVGFEGGNEQMADAIAQEVQRFVAGIILRAKSLSSAINDGLLAPDIQQGADKRNFDIEHRKDGSIGHAFKTIQSRAAQKVHEHGLHLIICRVTNCHRLRCMLTRVREQKAIAKGAGGFFNREFFFFSEGVHIRAFNDRGQTKPGRHLFHSIGFDIGTLAQSVIEMGNNDGITRLTENVHQAQAVWST